MERTKNLAELTKNISDKLFDSINLLEILEEVVEGERKEYFLVSTLQKNIEAAFDEIEDCRQLISIPD